MAHFFSYNSSNCNFLLPGWKIQQVVKGGFKEKNITIKL